MRKLLNKIFISGLLGLGLCLAEVPLFAANTSGEVVYMYNNAFIAIRNRRFTMATKLFEELIEKYPEDSYAVIARRQLAILYRDMKEYDKSIALFKELIEDKNCSHNDRQKLRTELIAVLRTVQRYREGIDLLEAWLKEEPDNVLYALKLSDFYLQSGGKDEAVLLLERFMERGEKEAFSSLLDLYMRSGEVDKLLENLENNRTRYKTSVYLEYAADCYLALGRKDKAIETITQNPNYLKDIGLLQKVADIQLSINKTDDAIATLEKLIALTPGNKQVVRKLGHCYFVKGDKDKAVQLWRRLIYSSYGVNQEAYTEYTSVLIEHQLLTEALEAFEEARREMRNDTAFAEEKAAVLTSLGRDKEAMEEYLKLLASGIYKTETFDRLYNAEAKGFSLEERLKQLNSTDFNQAITQALIEYYFRKARMSDIDKMLALVDDYSSVFFDDLFYNRLRQEAMLVPEQFHFNLMKSMMKLRKGSSLELKLALLMLNMPEYCENWKNEVYKLVKGVADSKDIADYNLRYDLNIRLAEFALYEMHSPEDADKYLSDVLKSTVFKPAVKYVVNAKILKAKARIYSSDFEVAQSELYEVEALLDEVKYNNNYLSAIEREEFIMQYHLESARLKCYKEDYQDALSDLHDIIEKYKEGYCVSDALEMGLEITRYSIGDFSVIKHKLAAERLAICGKPSEAVNEIDEAIKALPASSSLRLELDADKLIYGSDYKNGDAMLKEMELFIAKNPDCFKTPDIWALKIKLMQRLNKSQDVIDEEMRGFMNVFPSDLRSGKYKLTLDNSGGKK